MSTPSSSTTQAATRSLPPPPSSSRPMATAWPRPRRWGKRSPARPRRPRGARSCSSGTAFSITAESRLWRTQPAKPDWSFRSMGSRYPHSSGERSELADRVVRVNRVAKVVKGGRKFSFSALIVVGDMNGRVGSGIGKAREVTEAIRKGMEVAKRNMITVPMVGTTIPHEVRLKLGSARIMLKPAAPGTGVISGGAMRAVIETAGMKDILTKSHGTNNPINTVRATLAALQQLRTAQQIAELRGKEVEQIVGKRLAAAYRRQEAGGVAAEPTPVEAK